MLEFIFRLYKTKMIDVELWSRWEATAKSMITIPRAELNQCRKRQSQ
jgi:hypothetical protein